MWQGIVNPVVLSTSSVALLGGVEPEMSASLALAVVAMQGKLSGALKEYRLLHGAHVRNPGALIYPSTLRYLPPYVLGLIRTTAFRSANMVQVYDRFTCVSIFSVRFNGFMSCRACG